MQWIEGIRRQNGRLVAQAVNPSGDRQLVPLADMQPPPKEYATYRHKISTDLGSWTEAPVAEYLAELNFTPEVKEGHQIFAFTHNEVRYLVPSLVLMRALFRPFPRLTKHLFSPQGLSQATAFKMEGSKPLIREISSLQVDHKYSSTLQALSWFWAFPSAHETWHSIYSHAESGNLAMDLPAGNMACMIHGIQNGSAFFVVAVTVLDVETAEKPFGFAEGHPQLIEFRDKVGKTNRHSSNALDIPTRENAWVLSDEEWQAVMKLIVQDKQHNNQKHDLRGIIDLIVEKVGTGTPWRNSSNASIPWNAAQRHYRRWVTDGRWEKIRSTLIQLRCRSSDLA